jgi:dephospho-CoA kinase
MKWIGLTGGIGSGKSTVAKVLRSKGFAVIDADEMARRSVGPGSAALAEVVRAFGQKILNPDGSLDRKALGGMVFGNPSQLETLEKITHPAIQKLVLEERRRFESEGRALAFYDIPLLFEKSLEALFDTIVVVDCPLPLRIQRVMRRDGLSEEEVRLRIARQHPLEEKEKRAHFVLINDGEEGHLEAQVQRMIAEVTNPKSSRK